MLPTGADIHLMDIHTRSVHPRRLKLALSARVYPMCAMSIYIMSYIGGAVGTTAREADVDRGDGRRQLHICLVGCTGN